MRKRGQLTVFVIIGLVLVMSTLLFIYIRQSTDLFRPREVVPAWVQPLKMDVENCLQQVATNGVKVLALRGGYIELPATLARDSRGVMELMEGSPFIVPYWHYKGRSYMPTRHDMEKELQSHINDEIDRCLANFSGHRNIFDIRIISPPNTNATIGDKTVSLRLYYPIEVDNKASTEKTEVSSYQAEVDLPLGRLHDLAKEIMEKETEDQFLEKLTMEMIAGSGPPDKEGLPYEGFEFTCGKREWSVRRDIIPRLTNLLKYNLHFINFKGTNREDSGYPYFEKLYLVELDGKYPNIRVSTDATFTADLRIHANVRPGQGDKVTTLKYDMPLIGSCIKIYHHRYTLDFPILFQLVHDTGFTFNFATPVLIRDNQPFRHNAFLSLEEEDLGYIDEEYCAEAEFPLTIYAKDKVTEEYLSDVNITHRCVMAKCEIGTTKRPTFAGTMIEHFGAVPYLTEMFPPCYNGLIIGEKESYLDGYAYEDTIGPQGSDATVVFLTPLQEFDIEVRVVEYPSGEIRRMHAGEIAIVTVTNVENRFDNTYVYPEAADRIKLIKGEAEYDLNVFVTSEDELVAMYELSWTPVLEGTKIIFYAISDLPLPESNEDFMGFWETVEQHSPENMPRFI